MSDTTNIANTLPKNTFGMLKYFYTTFKARTVIAILLLFVASVLEGIGIAFLLPIMAQLLGEGSQENFITQVIFSVFDDLQIPLTLHWLVFSLITFIILKFLISFFAMSTVAKTSAIVVSTMRMKLIETMLAAKWSYFTKLAAGRSSNSISSEGERAAQAYMTLCITLSDLLLIIVYMTLAFLVSWYISFAALFTGLIIFVLTRRVMLSTRIAADKQTKHMNSLIKKLSDSLGIIKPIKAMAKEQNYKTYLEAEIDVLKDSQTKRMRNKEFTRLLKEPLVITILSIGLLVSVEYTNISTTQLSVLSLFFLRMAMKTLNFQTNWHQLIEYESAFWSLWSLIKTNEDQKEHNAGTAIPHFKNKIQISKVNFEHVEGQALLNDVSLSVDACKLYTLVGPSGSGKTTLIDIILGLYKPQSGTVKIDGQDLKDINIEMWRQRIGYVSQDFTLMNDTVANNVTFGDQNYSEEEIHAAIKKAGAEEFINQLENGIHENVGERGNKLSGGQKQRIAIARALIQKPDLLLLDEPTSALDSVTEGVLMATLKDLADTMTIIVISHSERVTQHADQVIYIENGRVKA